MTFQTQIKKNERNAPSKVLPTIVPAIIYLSIQESPSTPVIPFPSNLPSTQLVAAVVLTQANPSTQTNSVAEYSSGPSATTTTHTDYSHSAPGTTYNQDVRTQSDAKRCRGTDAETENIHVADADTVYASNQEPSTTGPTTNKSYSPGPITVSAAIYTSETKYGLNTHVPTIPSQSSDQFDLDSESDGARNGANAKKCADRQPSSKCVWYPNSSYYFSSTIRTFLC